MVHLSYLTVPSDPADPTDPFNRFAIGELYDAPPLWHNSLGFAEIPAGVVLLLCGS